MKTKSAFIFWSLIGFITTANLVVFDYIVLSSQDNIRVQFTPDDAYYYLQLAKNFVKYGYWTFDSKVSLASGFHPLLAYLLAVIYKVALPSTEEFVTIDILLSSIPILVLVFFVWLKSVLSRNGNFLIAISLFAGAQSFLFNSVSGVEWSFVVVLAALYCSVYIHSSRSTSASLKLFTVGLFLSLARSGAGLLPFSIFIAGVFFTILGDEENKLALRNSFIGLVGAFSGVGLGFINNYVFTGNIIQSSAKMKLYWGGFQENLLFKSIIIALRTIGFDLYFISFSTLCIPLLFIIVIICLLFLVSRGREFMDILRKTSSKGGKTNNQSVLYFASIVCVVGYFVLYSRGGGGLQNWYTANFLVPMFVLFDALINLLISRVSFKRGTTETALSLIILVTILVNILSVYPIPDRAPWQHQQVMLAAGKYLNKNHFDGKIASWNAGIIGYYQGGQVINIDGLVNESIYPYAVGNELPVYLKQENILYVIDFQTMLIPVYRKRGGYDDPVFLENLIPVARFDDGQFPVWQFLTLYRIRY